MEDYVFVCIGTNKLIEDSFGPRVGDVLEDNFLNYPQIKVLGTMKTPIHFQNAPIFLDYLQTKKGKIILIDSALGSIEDIGKTYMNLGGTQIGKAFGKSLYFPAYLSIKTVVGLKRKDEKVQIKNDKLKVNKNFKINSIEDRKRNLIRIKKLAQKVAEEVTSIVCEI